MFNSVTITLRCENQQQFLDALEQSKKMFPNLVVYSSSFNQRSVYNEETRRYVFPGDFTGTISMGHLRTENTTVDGNATTNIPVEDLLD